MEVLADPSDGLGWGSAGGQDHGSAAPTIADEQAALRRVATLVARGVSPAQLFAAVAQEVGNLFPDAAVARVGRYVTGSAVDCVGGWSRDGDTSWVGDRVPIAGHNSASLVFERNAPVRIERLTDDGTSATTLARASGTRSGVGAPIVVAGRLWGVMTLGFGDIDVLPPDIEYRLADFTDLIAIAIANIEAREELRRVANEQAALRRIATLVARGVSPAEVFAGVAQEVGAVFTEAEVALVGRYVDGDLEFVGGWSTEGPPSWVGTRVPLGGRNVATIVHERNEAVRVDHLGDDAAPATILARSTGSGAPAGAPLRLAGR
jgi:uncharacterized protein YoaH (UPF0181 family)